MDDKRYYEFLQRIPNQEGLNSIGFITLNGIPFKNNGDAVKYGMKALPALEPGSDMVVYDQGKCREAAERMYPEINRWVDLVEDLLKVKRETIDNIVEEINKKKDSDLLESVQKQVLREELFRVQGEHSGLTQMVQLLRTRAFELWECSRLKG
jgi:hypothetical protein